MRWSGSMVAVRGDCSHQRGIWAVVKFRQWSSPPIARGHALDLFCSTTVHAIRPHNEFLVSTIWQRRRVPCAKSVPECDVFCAIGVSFERKADSPNY